MSRSIRRAFYWLRHETLTWRVVAILTLTLFAIFALGATVYVRHEADDAERLFKESAAPRIAEVVSLLRENPELVENAAFIRLLDGPALVVILPPTDDRRVDKSLGRRGIVGFTEAKASVKAFIETHLRSLLKKESKILERPWNRLVDMYSEDRPTREWSTWRTLDAFPSQRKAVVAVRYGSERTHWVLFMVATDQVSYSWVLQIAAWAAIGGLFIVVFSVVVSRWATKPVRRFSDRAAELLAHDALDLVALPETGPTELQPAARAFNRALRTLQGTAEDRKWLLYNVEHELRHSLRNFKCLIDSGGDNIQRSDIQGMMEAMEELNWAMLDELHREATTKEHENVDIAFLASALCKNVGGEAAYSGPVHLFLRCSRERIRSAFANLIDNAITHAGEAYVELSEDDRTVRFTVRDRGPGIESDQREDVLVPGYLGGSGRGLFIARQAVRRHGGDIHLEAREGGGLEAVVTLPKSEQGAERTPERDAG